MVEDNRDRIKANFQKEIQDKMFNQRQEQLKAIEKIKQAKSRLLTQLSKIEIMEEENGSIKKYTKKLDLPTKKHVLQYQLDLEEEKDKISNLEKGVKNKEAQLKDLIKIHNKQISEIEKRMEKHLEQDRQRIINEGDKL